MISTQSKCTFQENLKRNSQDKIQLSFLVFLPNTDGSRFDILSPFDIAPIDFAIKCFSTPLSNCFIEEIKRKVIFKF